MLVRCLALVPALVALGCVPLPPAAVNSSLQANEALASTNPSNIAVVPVEDATRGGSARETVETFRQEVYDALVQRRYTPLKSRFVDPVVREHAAGVVNASMTRPDVLARVAGHLNEDALLAIRITQWDESRVMANARVRFAVEATMISASTKAVLWSGTLDGEVKAGREAAAPLYRHERVLDATKQVARALISQLPERN